MTTSTVSGLNLEALKKRYLEVRRFTERIVEPLSPEDCMVQSMDDVSPTRWHLAHTTWFFETFALTGEPGYRPFDEGYHYLFNSYYNALGKQFPRSRRGTVSRPGLSEIQDYRRHVDDSITKRLESPEYAARVSSNIQLGMHHEQQHQELMLTDIKHVLSCNPMFPVYRELQFDQATNAPRDSIEIDSGIYEIGHAGDEFAYDNESPRHKVYLSNCSLDGNLVTCGEYFEFIADDGYKNPDFWLSLGWSAAKQQNWSAPLYWVKQDGKWKQFTLAGLIPIEPAWPVCHVSLFEADAFARWAGKRLPTEFEWEAGAETVGVTEIGVEPFADYLITNDLAVHPTRSPQSLLGAVWQWTSSSYSPYPGYRPPSGALGEYNGKFMCNQYVLRGGSVATHSTHIRPSYRNFFPPDARWQFNGIRLVES